MDPKRLRSVTSLNLVDGVRRVKLRAIEDLRDDVCAWQVVVPHVVLSAIRVGVADTRTAPSVALRTTKVPANQKCSAM